MPKIFTHYDNLKVSRDAPQEVIEAAFRSLEQKYAPSKFQGSQEVAERMLLIRRAYEVLSDPELRQEHDAWIRREERTLAEAEAHHAARQARNLSQSQPIDIKRAMPRRNNNLPLRLFKRNFSEHWQYYAMAVALGYVVLANFTGVMPSWTDTPAYSQQPLQAFKQPAPVIHYQRPVSTPYGYPWPKEADYLAGSTQLNQSGLSSVTVDNTLSANDYHVKLVYLDAPQAYPVRDMYIPAHAMFKVERINAGHYDLRYRNLDTGELVRSDPLTLYETYVDSTRTFQNLKVTLYSVAHGNMQTHPIREKEF